jgi:hypothetical protein
MKNKKGQRSRKFSNMRNAKSFAEAVGGRFIDLRNDPNAKCRYKVKYSLKKLRKLKARKELEDLNQEFCPEEGRDFGYPNDYWD